MSESMPHSNPPDLSRYCRCDSPLYWTGCYTQDARMKKYLDPETIRHPAKMAPGLLARIFDHMTLAGLIAPGTTIVDFMSGTGRTAVEATRRGYRAVTVELEPKFVEFQKLNKKATEKALGRKVDWEIRQGDARKLSEILGGGAGIVSPPYEDSLRRKDSGIDLGKVAKKGGPNHQGRGEDFYSADPSNIGNLRKGTATIVSPPYGPIEIGKGLNTKPPRPGHNDQSGRSAVAPSQTDTRYSTDPGNIGHLPEGSMAGVTSPPYMEAPGENRTVPPTAWPNGPTYERSEHGTSDGQLGAQKPETYWEAMRTVYTEAFRCGISPLVVVTKDPTRNRAIVPLGATTCSLLEQIGYRIVCYHRAVLFEERKQATLDGDVKKSVAGRVSFFKRLSIAKGSPAARWEDVLIAVIPEGSRL